MLTTIGWYGPPWLADILGCTAIGKAARSCIVGSSDIEPLLSGWAWWSMLLWIPSLFISFLLIGALIAQGWPKPWGNRPDRVDRT
jgi:hypothetical protein